MRVIPSAASLAAILLAGALLAVPAAGLAHPGHAAPDPKDPYGTGPQPPSAAGAAAGIAWFNTPNRHATPLKPGAPQEVAKVTLELKAPSAVLVRFSSGLAAETSDGCPCSVRASLRADDGPLVVIKRVNVGAPTIQTMDRYEHDRQSADGGFVFELPAGRQTIALLLHIVDGSGTGLEAYYVNLQATPFAK